MNDPATSNPADPASAEGSLDAGDLAYELSGRLPCTSCGYNLAGLSVLDRCPECGTLIRETLLLLIDPFGDSVPKVRFPRLVAVAVVGCTASALAASVLFIANRTAALLCETIRFACGFGWLGVAGVATLSLCAISGFGLVRPMRATTRLSAIGAALGIVCIGAGAFVAAMTVIVHDPVRPSPYFTMAVPDSARVSEHAGAHLLLLLGVLLFRPNARAISSTAWRVRENHDNRQRLLTVAASLAAVLVGDALMLGSGLFGSTAGVAVGLCGELLVFASSCILAIALLGVALDSISIATTLWRFPVAFRDVVRRAGS